MERFFFIYCGFRVAFYRIHYQCTYDGLIEEHCMYCTVAYNIETGLLSPNKRTIAQVSNDIVRPSNEHFSSNDIQSNKMAPVAKHSNML